MYKIGIDLGGTNIAAGVIDEQNRIVGTASVKTNVPRPAEEIADSIKEAALMAMVDASVLMQDVESVGIGCPGAVNAEGVVENSANLGFKNTPLRDLVEERLGKPTFIGNDANVAALGEQVAGCGNGVPDFVAVTIGTGVGGGIILNGKLLTGINGAAGEVGHIMLMKDGVQCGCGRRGCFERYASATAMIREAKETLSEDVDKTSVIWNMVEGDLDKLDALVVWNAAHEGDAMAQEIVDQFIEYLAIGVTDLVNIFQPEMVCIGGGMSKQGDALIVPLREKVARMRYTKYARRQTEIVAATLGNDAGIIGAALLADQN